MELIKQLVWRLKFILFHMWGMDLSMIFYTLFPFMRKDYDFRTRFLHNNNLLNFNEEDASVTLDGSTIYYGNKVPVTDLISIFLYHNPLVQKNFIKNPAFHFEAPYEDGGVALKEGDVVIDAGANIGLFSLLASKKVGSTGKIFAFEPVKEAKHLLEQNIEASKISNIILAPFALGDTKKQISFSIDDGLLGSSGIFTKSENTELVDQVTLDDYVRENNISRIDFLKADIEGMERYFLQGAEQTIKKYKPRIAICIYHLPDDPEVIQGLLEKFVPEYKFYKTETKLFAHV